MLKIKKDVDLKELEIYVSEKENIRFLPLIKVIDKPYKSIHIVGRDFHDSLNIQSGGINYYNLQNGCGTLAGNKGTYEFVGEENEYSCFPVVELAYAKSLEQHEEEIRKPLEEEIVELKEHIRALKSSHDLSHQAYLFAKNEGLDLQNQERQKVIAELEEFEKEHRLRARKTSKEYPTDNEEQKARLYALSSGRFDILENLKQKLNEMKGEK